MKADELWGKFIKDKLIDNEVYDTFAFGDDADKLLSLVKEGIKTSTSSLHILYKLEEEELPKEGQYSVVLDSNNDAGCIIKTNKVYICEFENISEEHALKEGEGDRSLAYWRMVHEKFFTKCLEEYDLEFNEHMKVVCEEFEMVYKID